MMYFSLQVKMVKIKSGKRANELVANANVLFKNLYRGLGATPKHW